MVPTIDILYYDIYGSDWLLVAVAIGTLSAQCTILINTPCVTIDILILYT